MPNTVKKYKITQLQQDDSLLELHPETDADIVNYSGTIGSTAVTNVKAALDAIAGGIGVTGVKGDAESTYRTGQVNLTPAKIGAEPAFTDGSATIASESSSVVTIKTSVTQSGGAIAAGSNSITLAKVAKTGVYSDLTGKPTLGTAAAKDTGTSSGNVPVLDSNGKLDSSILPAIAITDTFTAASQAAMLALTAQKGDICIRTDVSKTYILTADPASTLANWKELATPTDAVSSVNGKTGVVVLTGDDIECASTGGLYDGQTIDTAISDLSGKISDILDGDTPVTAAKTLVDNSGEGLDIGSTTTPVYFNDGAVTACSTYAGGTAVTLNGTSKAATTASFYAPTGAGTSGQVLKSNGSGAPSWVDQSTIAAGTAANFATAKTIALTGDVVGSASGGASGGWSVATTLATQSGLSAGTYSAVTVNAKGLVTAGGQFVEVGGTGQTTPSASLAVGGLFFQEI